jgi:hypothetical protein
MADIKGIEIFAEGTWNGNKITKETLNNIVSAFNATKNFIKPVLKLGHNDEQQLLKNDGLPAAGWVSNVYIRGKKLVADFVDIPDKIYELIKKKAYRKVSVEIFRGYSFEGNSYPDLLGAVALLGADTPAVMTLSDILGQYKNALEKFTNNDNSNKIEIEINSKDLIIEEFTKTEQGMPELEDLKSQIEQLQSRLDEISKEKIQSDERYQEYKKQTDEKLNNLENEKKTVEIEKYTLDLTNKQLISPSMKPYVEALLSTDRQEYSIGDEKLSSKDLIEKTLKLAKEIYSINKDEKTVDAKPDAKDSYSDQEKKIEEYMATHKVSFSAAYRAVLKKPADQIEE